MRPATRPMAAAIAIFIGHIFSMQETTGWSSVETTCEKRILEDFSCSF
jgi:hypothetical protein